MTCPATVRPAAETPDRLSEGRSHHMLPRRRAALTKDAGALNKAVADAGIPAVIGAPFGLWRWNAFLGCRTGLRRRGPAGQIPTMFLCARAVS